MSRKYPSAAGADPGKVAEALVSPPIEDAQEEYEALVRAYGLARGKEQESLRQRLLALTGLDQIMADQLGQILETSD